MKYIVEGPDGKRYVVEGPGGPATGGSPTQAQTAAPEPSQAPYERAGGYGPVLAGVADAGIKTALGLKQLFGGLSPENKAVLQQMQQENAAEPNKFLRGSGEFGANVALTAIPGIKAENALRAAMGGGRAAAVGASALAAGGQEALTSVGEGDTYAQQMANKGKSALTAAALGGGLSGAGQVLARPFQATPEAQRLMDMGITPTLQQGAEGKLGRFVGGMSGGAGASLVKERQNQQTIAEMLRQITPGVDYKGKSTSEMVGIMDDVLKQQYGDILGGKIYQMTPTARAEIWKAARQGAGREQSDVADVLRNMGEVSQALSSSNNVRMGTDAMSAQRQRIQDAINQYSIPNATVSDNQIRRGLVAAKNRFDETVRNTSLSPEELASLSNLDSRYSDAVRVMQAAKSPEAQKQLKVSDMMRAYAQLDPTGGIGFAKATAPMQRDLLEPATRTMNLTAADDSRAGIAAVKRMVAPFAAGGSVLGGATLGGPAVGVPLAAGYGLSLLGQTEQGARALFGQTSAQKKLAELLRQGGIAPAAASATDVGGY